MTGSILLAALASLGLLAVWAMQGPTDEAAHQKCLASAKLPYEIPADRFCECYVDETNTLVSRVFRAILSQEARRVATQASIHECTAAAYEWGQLKQPRQ